MALTRSFLLDHNGKTWIYRRVSGSFNVLLRRKHDSPMEEDDCTPLVLIRVNLGVSSHPKGWKQTQTKQNKKVQVV